MAPVGQGFTNASSFITLALEQNWNRVQSTEGYAKYITNRPRAERLGSHGLFGDADHVSLDKAMNELERYTGNVGNIFRDNAPRPAAPTGVQIDHKRLQRLREKKMAMGQM